MKLFVFLRRHGLPVVAVAAGLGAALSGFERRSAATARAESRPTPSVALATASPAIGSPAPIALPPDEEEGEAAGESLSGEVLEQLDVEKYSYLRLGEKGQPGLWAAVPSAPPQLGRRVTVTQAQVMTQFFSATLKRTFETIYFGLLEGSDAGAVSEAAAALREPSHALATDLAKAQPHPGAGPSADKVSVGRVPRASGPLARTVMELNAARPESAGARARVRAVVVKSTSGVLGRTFLHVRDGSGEAGTGSNDLAVTTSAEPAVGTQVVLEGTIEVDKDFGSGYRYRVLLADATLVAD